MQTRRDIIRLWREPKEEESKERDTSNDCKHKSNTRLDCKSQSKQQGKDKEKTYKLIVAVADIRFGKDIMTGEPSLCINGCGFFSTSQTKNLCSKCYSDFLKDESARYLATLRGEHTGTAAEAAEEATMVEETEESTAREANVVKKRKERSRCNACKKKVGLLGFQCRCGHVFCGSHRHPEEHSCQSDYKSTSINQLLVQNPIINGNKLNKI